MKKDAFGFENELANIYLPESLELGGPDFLTKFDNIRSLAVDTFHRELTKDGSLFWLTNPDQYVDFAKNGARFYQDLGALEVAGRESRTPKGVARHEAECEALLLEHLIEFNSLTRTGSVSGLPKGILELSKKGSSFADPAHNYGVHENYYMAVLGMDAFKSSDHHSPYSETAGVLADPLIHFCISRVPFLGCGELSNSGDFIVSPRGRFAIPRINNVADEATRDGRITGRKFMVMIRKDHDVSDVEDGFARIQIICSDMNVSSLQTDFKFGTTAVVLGMIEAGFLKEPPVRLRAPEGAMDIVSCDVSLQERLEVDNGAEITALGLNELYFKLAMRFFERHPMKEWEKDSMLLWGDWLKKMKNSPWDLEKVVDWMITKKLAEQTLAEKYGLDLSDLKIRLKSDQNSKSAQTILRRTQWTTLKYFFLFSTRLRERLTREGKMDGSLLFHSDLLEDPELRNPPLDTRAYGRHRLMSFFERHNLLKNVNKVIWGRVMVYDRNRGRHSFFNRDPLDPSMFYTDKGEIVTEAYLQRHFLEG